MTTTPLSNSSSHAVLFQGLSYENFDHYFSDTKACVRYDPTQDDGLVTSQQLYDDIPTPPDKEFAYKVWKAQFVEPTFNMFGNDEDGNSVQVAIRGYRPFLRLLVEDASLTLLQVRQKVSKFCRKAFDQNQFKKALEDHVLIQESKLVELLDFYTFNGNVKKRFLEVYFHSFAAYNHLKSILNHLWVIENYNEDCLPVGHIERELAIQQKHLDQHYEVSKWKSNQKDPAKLEYKKQHLMSKEGKKAKEAHIQRLRTVIKAYTKTEYLNGAILDFALYDSALPPVLDLMTRLKADSQWFEVPMIPFEFGSDHEIPLHRSAKKFTVVDISEIHARNDIIKIPPLMICGIDIETYASTFKTTKNNHRIRQFPNPLDKGSICFQIGVTAYRYGAAMETMKKYIFTLGNPVQSEKELLTEEDPAYIKYFRCDTEYHLLVTFMQWLNELDVTIFTGYNSKNFDFYYIYQRCVFLALVKEAKPPFGGVAEPTKIQYNMIVTGGLLNETLSRSGVTNIQQKNSVFETGAFGMAEYRQILMPGRIHIDLLPYMRKEFKLQKYSLDFVAKHFLNEGKDDVKPEQIHQAFETKNQEDLRRIADYCVQDTALLQRLMNHKKTQILENLMETARVSFVPIDFIINRGQQIKVFSQLSRKAREQGKAIPHVIEDSEFVDHRLIGRLDANGDLIDVEEDRDDEQDEMGVEEFLLHQGEVNADTADQNAPASPRKKRNGAKQYEGATVIEPKVGLYNGRRIVCLDFASLYPSLIRENNIDYFTLITNRVEIERLMTEGFQIVIHDWVDRVNGTHFYTGIAMKDAEGNVVRGAMPEMLTELGALRKSIKKEMITELDPQRKSMLNAKQLAVKISSNSTYGYCASQMMRCPTISALVCYLGRLALTKTAALAQTKYGCRVIYGDTDSVFLDFDPIDSPPTMSMEDLFRLASEAAKFLTDEIFRKANPNTPMELEFEKVYSPLLMYAKKRYEGKEYSIDEYQTKLLREKHPHLSRAEQQKLIVIGEPEHKWKGVVTSRRDTVQVANMTYSAVITHILNQGDISGIIKIIRMNVLQIQNDLYTDYKLFSTTQSVKDNDSYVNPGSTAAVVVAQRLRDRGIAVPPGSTVSYVYLDERDIQPLPPSMQEYARSKPLKAHAAEDVDTAQQLKYRLDKSYYVDRIKSALKRFVGLCSMGTQREINKIYSDAIQMEQYLLNQYYNTSGEKRIMMSDHTPWLNIAEGLCPWQGTDEGENALGSTCAASSYLKALINQEISIFKRNHGPRYPGTKSKWIIRCPINCKQVYNGRAIIELQSQDPFCPVHNHIHQRTLKNAKCVPHRLRITSSGIGYICMKEGNNNKWPPLYKDGTSSAPLKTPKLKEIFQKVNHHLQILKRTYEEQATGADDLTNLAEGPDSLVPETSQTINNENSVMMDNNPVDTSQTDETLPSVISKKPEVKSKKRKREDNVLKDNTMQQQRKIIRMPIMPKNLKKPVVSGIDMSL